MDHSLPELEKSEVDEIVDVFKDVYQSALRIVSARVRKLDKTNNVIVSEWSQRGLERGSSIKILRTAVADLCLKSCFEIDSVDVSQWALNAFSKSEQLRAIIRTVPNESVKGTTKYFLEIWSEGKCKQTFDLAGLDEHGAVYTDDCFGSLSWSNVEDKVVYIAEQKEAKTSPFYQQKPLGDATDGSKNDCGRGDQYVYEEDWGEVISPKRRPVIVSCDILKKSITILEGVPKDFSPGQVICEPHGDGVIGVAFINTPRRLGLIYCTSRKSHVFYLSSKGEYVILSDKNVAVQSPRFSPDGKYLIWLQRPYGGPHHAAHSIVRCNWDTKEISVVVDIVQDSITTKNGKEFFGVFNQGFVTRCWTSDSKYLLFSTPQKYRINTYAVEIENGNIWDIGSKNEDESTIVLDVSEDDYALLNATSFKQPPTLSSLHIPSAISNSSDGPLLTTLTEQSSIFDKNIISRFTFPNEITKENCFATYYGPQNELNQSTPLILYPHGGPHAATSSAFSPAFHLFTRLGFGVLIVHFHGSTGIGQKYVDSLPGKIGSIDSVDCNSALQTAFKKFPWLDQNRVVLFGGSYGGFLVTILSSQYPNDFKAVVARNPVTNLILACFLSDIPDWATVESGFPYEGLTAVVDNPEIINKMMEVSPIKYIKNVKAPTLLLLGKKDLRVPPSQGLAYYHALKELNVPTKVLFYEDNHSLSTVPVEMDSIINSIIWFKRCLKRVTK
ncbi:acylamino-acid-releasing enzyme-like isoform X2 [Planococcus citri]|uniref:acylamino-acid-releasing enzyme-like isoform X2 n=1 Tax=Planococcus citri TaxID=170843 RepID=UPI0031F7E5F4